MKLATVFPVADRFSSGSLDAVAAESTTGGSVNKNICTTIDTEIARRIVNTTA